VRLAFLGSAHFRRASSWSRRRASERGCRAARKPAGIDVLPQQAPNVYDILRRDILVRRATP